MVLFFFLGSKAKSRASVCDSLKLRTEYLAGKVNTMLKLEAFKKQVLKYSKNRYVFYVMINDGDLRKGNDNIYFPGHVFVIEKYPVDDKNTGYHVFQSYINQYDLKGYLNKAGNTFDYTHDEMKHLLGNLHTFFSKPVWDNDCVDIWSKFTKVDSSEFIGAQHQKVLSLCYTRDKLTHCLEKISNYTKAKLKDLDTIPNKSSIYGDDEAYHEKDKAITVSEMQKTLHRILSDIRQNTFAK